MLIAYSFFRSKEKARLIDEIHNILFCRYDIAHPYNETDEFVRSCTAGAGNGIMYCGYDCAENDGEYEVPIRIIKEEVQELDPIQLRTLVIKKFCICLAEKYGKDISPPTAESFVWFDG